MSTLKPVDVLAEVIADPAGSFEMMKIRNKLGQMVNPKANAHQIRMAKAWQYAFKEGKPLRLLLKYVLCVACVPCDPWIGGQRGVDRGRLREY